MPTSFDLALALAIIKGGEPRNPQDAVELADRLDAELSRRGRYASLQTAAIIQAVRDDDLLRDWLRIASRDASSADPGAVEAAVRDAAGEHAGLRGLLAADAPGRVVPTPLIGVARSGFGLPALSAALLEQALDEVAWEEVVDVLSEGARS